MFASWISYCFLDDHAVVFDTHRNRYTAVPARLALDLAGGRLGDLPEATLHRIRSLGWISGNASAPVQVAVAPAIERELPPYQASTAHPLMLLSAATALQGARCRLKLQSLDTLLARISRDNRRVRLLSTVQSADDLVGAFGLTRRFLGGAKSCLPSSLGLHALLARKGHSSQLVFGVKLRPFAAHCWVQTEGTVLGDTIEQVGPYSVIKVVE